MIFSMFIIPQDFNKVSGNFHTNSLTSSKLLAFFIASITDLGIKFPSFSMILSTLFFTDLKKK